MFSFRNVRDGLATAIVVGAITVSAAEASPFSLGDTVYLSNQNFVFGSPGAFVTATSVAGFAAGGLTQLTLNPGSVFDAATTVLVYGFCTDPTTSVRYGPFTVAQLDNRGRGWNFPQSYAALTTLQKAQLGWLMHTAIERIPTETDPDTQTALSGAFQFAVWTVLNPEASWSSFGTPALATAFTSLMAELPTSGITPDQYPVYQLIWRNEDGTNFGQPWMIPAPKPEVVPEPTSAALFGLGLFGLAALRRRLY